jgi:hypothetical protein
MDFSFYICIKYFYHVDYNLYFTLYIYIGFAD